MNRRLRLADVVFAKTIPRDLDPGVLYVSMEHATAIHACMCGCGQEVVTPFGRRSWRVCYDGTWISLTPSIGNAALPCRSHYILRDSRVIWLPPEGDDGVIANPSIGFMRRLLTQLRDLKRRR